MSTLISGRQLAREAGVHYQTISYWVTCGMPVARETTGPGRSGKLRWYDLQSVKRWMKETFRLGGRAEAYMQRRFRSPIERIERLPHGCLTSAQLAAEVRCKRKLVTLWGDRGCPCDVVRGVRWYDPRQVLAWLASRPSGAGEWAAPLGRAIRRQKRMIIGSPKTPGSPPRPGRPHADQVGCATGSPPAGRPR